MDRQYLLDLATDKVRMYWACAQSAYPAVRGMPSPTVKINARLKTTAGLAYGTQHRVEFSAELMWEHTDHFICDTIPHEVAHIVADLQYVGCKAHGAEWRTVMKFLSGIEPQRCHNLVNSVWAAKKAKAI